MWLDKDEGNLKDEYLLRSTTQESLCYIKDIPLKFDPAFEKEIKNPNSIKEGEIGIAQIKLEDPLIIEPFSKLPELGRFVLEKDKKPVAGGIVL
jgi:translation elongation factor EF-1alpha